MRVKDIEVGFSRALPIGVVVNENRFETRIDTGGADPKSPGNAEIDPVVLLSLVHNS